MSFTLAPLVTPAQNNPKGKTVRLLTVGNSFSQNATKYLDKIAEADGNTLIHHRCVIGGSGPEQHLAKAAANEKDPNDKAGLYGTGKSLKEELAAEKADKNKAAAEKRKATIQKKKEAATAQEVESKK